MSDRTKSAPWIGVLIFGALFFALNILLSTPVWFPAGRFALALRPVPESVAFALLIWWVRYSCRGRRTLPEIALGSLLGLFLGFAVAEAFFQFYFARAFMPAGDIRMIRGALLLFLGDIGPVVDLLWPIVASLLLAILAVLGTLMVRVGGALLAIRMPPPRWIVGAAALPLLGLAFVGVSPSLSARVVLGWFERPPDFVPVNVELEPTEDEAPVRRFALPGLLDRDLYIFVVEAYGYASFNQSELAREIDPYRRAYETALEANGYRTVSSFLESPVAGGYSWLAEATLLSGQLINSQERFLSLLDQELPTLTGMLHEAGYYTLTLRPGTVHGSWPEGWDLYRFEESLVAHDGDFGFKGPWFSYVPITDQFAIWTGERRVRELIGPGGSAEQRPLLAYYQLVSSHTPFNAIPPVIQPWSDLGDGSIYHERSNEIRRFDNSWTGGSELEIGYAAAVGYVFEVLTDYVARVMDRSRNPIIIVVGDHQPQRPIRAAANYKSVPIHVSSADPEVLAAFESRGFAEGMRSEDPPPHLHMKEFFAFFADLATTANAAE